MSLAPLSISRVQYAGQSSPYSAIVANRKASPVELDAAPGSTKRSSYAGSMRSSSDSGGAIPSAANHVVSTLTQTLPLSTGVSLPSSPGST